MSNGINGSMNWRPNYWDLANPNMPQGDSIDGMLENSSIDFDKLKSAADGKYNMGEIIVKNTRDPRLGLEIINNHVGGHAGENTRVIDSYQRQRTNMAVFKALLEHFVDIEDNREVGTKNSILEMDLRRVDPGDFDQFGNKYIKVAYDFLLGPDNLGENARPLSRDETRYLIDLLENGENTEEGAKDAVKRLNNLRKFKAGELTDTSSVRDLVRGLNVKNIDSEKRTRVMQVSVNQQAARVERTGGDYGEAVAFVNDEDNQAKNATVLGTKVLAENKEISHLILERVVKVAQKYGADLGKANSWDVAKTLLTGLGPKIEAAVRKYNANHNLAEVQPSSRNAYLAVFLQMSRALNTVLKDYGANWTEAGFEKFRSIMKKAIIHKLNKEPGFPASDRTNFQLANGKAIGNHARPGVDPMTRYSLDIENRSGRFRDVEANPDIRDANVNKSKEWFIVQAHGYESSTGFSIVRKFKDETFADMLLRRNGDENGLPSSTVEGLAREVCTRLHKDISKALDKMKEARGGLEDLTPLFFDGFVDLTTGYVAEWRHKKDDEAFLSEFRAAFRTRLAHELHPDGHVTELMPVPEGNDNASDVKKLEEAIQYDGSDSLAYVGSDHSVEDPVYSFDIGKVSIESTLNKVPGLLANVMKRCRAVNRDVQGWAAELVKDLEQEVRASVHVWCESKGFQTDEDNFVEQCLRSTTSLFTLGIATIEQLEDEGEVKKIHRSVMREINKLIP